MKTKSFHKLSILFFVMTTILFLLKSLISSEISLEDEMHYIATALRFCKGDAYLVDDWSPEQLNSFLLLPFIFVFKFLFHSTEGIVIYFRILHIFFKLFITLYAIYRLKKVGRLTVYTIIGILFYYFFTPYNIEALSYNTIPLSMIFLICIIMFTYKNRVSDFYICGILLAFSVLSQPFLSILYFFGLFIYSFYNLYLIITKKKPDDFFYYQNFIFLTLGVFTIAFIFLTFVFSRADISEILANIKYIFSEPDHNVSSNMFVTLLNKLSQTTHVFIFYCHGKITFLNLICFGIIIFCKCLNKIKPALTTSILFLLITCILILISNNAFIINAIYIPFVWFGLELAFLITQNKVRHIFILSICLIYTACTALGTNTGILSTSASMSIFAIFSIIMVSDISADVKSVSKANLFFTSSIFTVILVSTLIMRIFIVWTDIYNINTYTCFCNKGPLKGTFANKEVYGQYTAILDNLDTLNYQSSDILFCGTSTPTAYLYMDVEFGTMGTPFFYLDYDRVKAYFALHPDKIPTIIYYEELSGTAEEHEFLEYINVIYKIEKNKNQLLAVKKGTP